MNPAVLNAFGLAIIAGGSPATYPGISGHEADLTLARKNAAKIDQSMAELRKIAPDAGSYVSETNFFEPSWQRPFWGPNYRNCEPSRRNTIPPVSSSSTTVWAAKNGARTALPA